MEINSYTHKNNEITSLGIGITNRCNLNCPHCYSRGMEKTDISLEQAKLILETFTSLKKINFGTGESILNPNFKNLVNFFYKEGITLALTTNGLTIDMLTDKTLKKFKDVDVSLDFPTKELHDKWRGQSGVFENAINALEKCSNLGVDTSLALALMNHNYKHLPQFREIIDKYNINLRLNIFKPIQNDNFQLSYDEFWEAMKIISENFKVVSVSEPILSIITDTVTEGSPCGGSLRIHPDLMVTGCVYLDPQEMEVEEFIKEKQKIPEFCKEKGCQYIDNCQGGCFGRRILLNRPQLPDFYCPFYRGKKVPNIKFKKIEGKDFIHSKYLCTIILA